MDPQPVPPQPPEPIPAPPPPPQLKHLSGYLGMLLIVLGLGSLGFWIYTYYSASSKSEVVHVTPTPTPLVTPDPTADWKTYTQDKYQIKYPTDWIIKPISFGFSVDNGSYSINIETSNPGYGPGICIFSDSPNINNPYTDDPIAAASKCQGAFVETKGEQYIFRRMTSPNTSPDGTSTGNWAIYTQDSKGNFVTVPPVSYTGPISFDASTIALMDQILSTFTFVDATQSVNTANWKIITSKFWSFKVPQNWSSHKCTDVDESLSVGPEIPKDIVVSKVQCEGGGYSTLTVTRNSGGFSIPVSIAQNKSDPSAYFLTVKDKKNVQIGGQNAIIQTEEAYSFGPNNPVESVAVYIQKTGYTDSIIVADRSHDDPKTPPFLETKKIFDQILSTVQFMP